MKKLMTLAAVAVCSAAMADGIVSSSIVGYQALGYESAKKPLVGFTFLPVGGATKIKLGDVKATNMDPDQDYIQQLDPNTTKTTAQYTYFSAEFAKEIEDEPGEYDSWVGWWVYGEVDPEQYDKKDGVEIPVGQGFLMENYYAHDIKFTCSGSVPIASTEYDTSASKKPLVSCYLPTDMILGDIKVTNMDPDQDYIQILDPNTTKTSVQYTYFSAEFAKEIEDESGEYDSWVGWWVYGEVDPEEFEMQNSVPVKAGSTFLLENYYEHEIKFQYKSALDVTKPAAE